MHSPQRRSLSTLLPWVALVAVTLFAFAQVRARRIAEQRATLGAPAPALPVLPILPEHPTSGAAALAAEVARAEARASAQAAERARTQTELLAAQRAVAQARVQALEREVEREVERGNARVAAAEGAVRSTGAGRLVADAASGDPQRRARAESAARQEGADVLRSLSDPEASWRQDSALAKGALRLAPSLPPGEARVRLVVEAADAAPVELAENPSLLHFLRGDADALAALLSEGSAAARAAALQAVGPGSEPLDPERWAVVVARTLERWDAQGPDPAAARLLGLLRPAPAQSRLAQGLASQDPALRALCAWGLARLVPLESALRAKSLEATRSLLRAQGHEERAAGLLLAEALLGERLAFDPAGTSQEREAALTSLLPRLEASGR